VCGSQLLDEKFMGPPVTYGKSLNKEFRKRELMRITEENLVSILKRKCVKNLVVFERECVGEWVGG
jgi:hypothetical protein